MSILRNKLNEFIFTHHTGVMRSCFRDYDCELDPRCADSLWHDCVIKASNSLPAKFDDFLRKSNTSIEELCVGPSSDSKRDPFELAYGHLDSLQSNIVGGYTYVADIIMLSTLNILNALYGVCMVALYFIIMCLNVIITAFENNFDTLNRAFNTLYFFLSFFVILTALLFVVGNMIKLCAKIAEAVRNICKPGIEAAYSLKDYLARCIIRYLNFSTTLDIIDHYDGKEVLLESVNPPPTNPEDTPVATIVVNGRKYFMSDSCETFVEEVAGRVTRLKPVTKPLPYDVFISKVFVTGGKPEIVAQGLRIDDDLWMAKHTLKVLLADKESKTYISGTQPKCVFYDFSAPEVLSSEALDVAVFRVPAKLWTQIGVSRSKIVHARKSESIKLSGYFSGLLKTTFGVTSQQTTKPFKVAHTASTQRGLSGARVVVDGTDDSLCCGMHLGGSQQKFENLFINLAPITELFYDNRLTVVKQLTETPVIAEESDFVEESSTNERDVANRRLDRKTARAVYNERDLVEVTFHGNQGKIYTVNYNSTDGSYTDANIKAEKAARIHDLLNQYEYTSGSLRGPVLAQYQAAGPASVNLGVGNWADELDDAYDDFENESKKASDFKLPDPKPITESKPSKQSTVRNAPSDFKATHKVVLCPLNKPIKLKQSEVYIDSKISTYIYHDDCKYKLVAIQGADGKELLDANGKHIVYLPSSFKRGSWNKCLLKPAKVKTDDKPPKVVAKTKSVPRSDVKPSTVVTKIESAPKSKVIDHTKGKLVSGVTTILECKENPSDFQKVPDTTVNWFPWPTQTMN